MKIDHEKFNISMRKFLKKVGVTSQQKIEESVRSALEKNLISNDEVKIKVILEIDELDLKHQIDGEILLGTTR
ncbi:MAG: DUF6494 family protein [Paracoccaceae bacterium]|nr:DUF6494 family protein [Paracoccaceae bacterium]